MPRTNERVFDHEDLVSGPSTQSSIGSPQESPRRRYPTPPATPARSARILINQQRSSSRSRNNPPSGSSHRNPRAGPSRNNPPPRRRRRKNKYPTKILREIKHFQQTTNLLIPRAPFSRVVREVLQERGGGGIRITPEAFNCTQEAAEMYLTHILEDAYRCTIFRNAVTLHPRDIELVEYIRKGVWQ